MPGLAKLSEILKVFGIFECLFSLSNFEPTLSEFFIPFGKFSLLQMAKYSNKNLASWSHWVTSTYLPNCKWLRRSIWIALATIYDSVLCSLSMIWARIAEIKTTSFQLPATFGYIDTSSRETWIPSTYYEIVMKELMKSSVGYYYDTDLETYVLGCDQYDLFDDLYFKFADNGFLD